MGKVTPYQQSELASQLVGVPQQDNSALQVANAMTNSAGALGNAVSQANAQNQADMQNFQNQAMSDLKSEIGAHRAASNYLNRQLAQANRDATVSNLITSADNAMTEADAEIIQKFAQAPLLGIQAVKDSHNSIQDKYTKASDDPLVQSKVQVGTNSAYVSRLRKMTDWAKTTETNNNISRADINRESTKKVLADTVGVGDTKTLGDKIKAFADHNDMFYKNIYGPQAGAKMMEATSGMATSVLRAWSDKAPGQVRDILATGAFDNMLSQEQKNTIMGADDSNYNSARSIAQARIVEGDANISAQVRDIEAKGAGLNQDNITEGMALVRQLDGMYREVSNRETGFRDSHLENQILSTMWKINSGNKGLEAAMATELNNNNTYKLAQEQFAYTQQQRQRSENTFEVNKLQTSNDAINAKTKILRDIDGIKQSINSAGGIGKAVENGAVSIKPFRDLQKKIYDAGESRLFSAGTVKELTEALDKQRNALYPAGKVRSEAVIYLDTWRGKELEGPSERLKQLFHIPNEDRKSPEYMEIKNNVTLEVKEWYRATGTPENKKFTPQQVDRIWDDASHRVWMNMSKSGAMGRILEKNLGILPTTTAPFNPSTAKKEVHAELVQKSKQTKSTPVARPAAKAAPKQSTRGGFANAPGFNNKTTPNSVKVPPPPPNTESYDYRKGLGPAVPNSALHPLNIQNPQGE